MDGIEAGCILGHRSTQYGMIRDIDFLTKKKPLLYSLSQDSSGRQWDSSSRVFLYALCTRTSGLRLQDPRWLRDHLANSSGAVSHTDILIHLILLQALPSSNGGGINQMQPFFTKSSALFIQQGRALYPKRLSQCSPCETHLVSTTQPSDV